MGRAQTQSNLPVAKVAAAYFVNSLFISADVFSSLQLSLIYDVLLSLELHDDIVHLVPAACPQVSIIYDVLPEFHDDTVHLFPAACLPCNLGAAMEVVETAGAWRGLLFRGIRGSGTFRFMSSGLMFFFLFFSFLFLTFHS